MRFTTRTAPGVKRLYRYASLPLEVKDMRRYDVLWPGFVVCLDPESHYHPSAEQIETTFAGWTR